MPSANTDPEPTDLLGFKELNLNRDGTIMTREQIVKERRRRGLCTTCVDHPTVCYERRGKGIAGRRFSRAMKAFTHLVPRTEEGVVIEGVCLRCLESSQDRLLSTEYGEILKKIASNDPSLCVVNLNDHNIGDGGVKRLADLLRYNTFVFELDLGSNGISNAGAMALADAIRVNFTLAVLWLDDNVIGDIGAEALAKALSADDCSLTELSLTSNAVRDDGAEALADALLSNNCSLTKLDLAQNNISPELEVKVRSLVEINSEESKRPKEARQRKAAEFGSSPRRSIRREDGERSIGMKVEGEEESALRGGPNAVVAERGKRANCTEQERRDQEIAARLKWEENELAVALAFSASEVEGSPRAASEDDVEVVAQGDSGTDGSPHNVSEDGVELVMQLASETESSPRATSKSGGVGDTATVEATNDPAGFAQGQGSPLAKNGAAEQETMTAATTIATTMTNEQTPPSPSSKAPAAEQGERLSPSQRRDGGGRSLRLIDRLERLEEEIPPRKMAQSVSGRVSCLEAMLFGSAREEEGESVLERVARLEAELGVD